ncbi:NAD-dependent epimerase/dehydratase family protein [Pseudorhodobacter ferrugineus]|uniref:NAD-dependent epimerase/dehydratase family protein n=1 Tax=Pseudorhodobacter ferrugineus TaxID=77008 RepID=UPI00040D4600|nr:NAD(P)-dependent oxidoreductase [Pseudorhodobacter ferrugineus]
MEKLVVIGGSGFIGTRLCQRLSDHQIPFEILDLKPSRRFPDKSRITDIRDLAQLRAAVSGDVIIHLAAVHRDDVTNPDDYQTTNVDGTANVCTVAAEKGINRIVFTSSVAVYGFAPLGTDESGAIAPFNAYGRTKYEAEGKLEAWLSANAQASLMIVRPTVVFGEGNRGNVFNLLNQIASGRFLMIGNGRNRKSMAYVENIAAFLHHASGIPTRRVVVNYVDGPDFDMNSLVSLVRQKLRGKYGTGMRLPYWLGLALGYVADLVTRVTDKKLPVSSIRVKKFCSDSAFLSAKESICGFKAPISLQDGVLRTLEAEFISPDLGREIFFTE